MAIHNWPAKDPDEVLDYAHDWSARLGEDTLAGNSTAAEDDQSGVAIDSQSFADGVQTVWVSGGAHGRTATITLRLTTAGGRTYEETALLPIRYGGAA